MATREETRLRRAALRDHLLEAGRGEMVTLRATETVRVLSSRFHLSVNSVLDVQKELARSGALQVVPRVGVFARQPVKRLADGEQLFLMVHGPRETLADFTVRLSREFQDRVALLGGSALTLEWNVALSLLERGELPPLAGLFDMSPHSKSVPGATRWSEKRPVESLPRVRYATRTEETCDILSFDDEGGGYLATRHLLGLGCQRIAFLGISEGCHTESPFGWACERENGWRRALAEAEISPLDLAFYPSDFSQVNAGNDDLSDEALQSQAGCMMAHDIAVRGDIDGIVAANDLIAHGLLIELRQLGVSAKHWPALVGFDADPRFSAQFLTSLLLPWEEIGRAAANILHARATGTVQGAAQKQQVAMKLIPRLSCRTEWFYPATQSALLQSAIPVA